MNRDHAFGRARVRAHGALRSATRGRSFTAIMSVFLSIMLAVTMVPVAAFAAPAGDVPADANGQMSTNGNAADASDGDVSADANGGSSEGDGSTDIISSEGDGVPEAEKSRPSNEGEDAAQAGEDANLTALPAGAMINQEVALDTVAQAESTRSFFLAQTLESTRTVPVVSAKLPIDTGAGSSTDAVVDEGDGASQPEGDPGSDDPVDPSFTLGSSEGDSAAVAAESTVIGSFEYRGITYAVEPGGESVAVVAADYSKLPSDFIEAQTIVLPSVVSPDGIDYYSVTRIADDAFASLTAAAAAENGQDADASFDVQAQAEACAYEDQATSESAEGDGAAPQVISGEVSLSDDPFQHVISSDTAEAPNPHVISSGASEAGGVEKSRPSGEGEGEALTDSTEAESIGITAITIPASITTIEDDAFSGFDTLQYVIVSEENPNYSMYDGCLYDKAMENLLLVPESRKGAVRIAKEVTTLDPEALSHQLSVTTLVADADSAAYSLLSENDLYNSLGERITVITTSEADEQGLEPLQAEYESFIEEKTSEDADVFSYYGDAGLEERLVSRNSATNCYLYHRGTVYFWSNETPSANATTGTPYYIANGSSYGSTLKSVAFNISDDCSAAFFGMLSALMTATGGSNANTSSIGPSYGVRGIRTADYIYGSSVPVPKPMPKNSPVSLSPSTRMNIWVNDYWYNQPLGAWFIADANPYYYGYMRYEVGSGDDLPTGAFSDGTVEKCQAAGGTAGTSTSAPTGSFTINYPATPPIPDSPNQVFKGWCSKPDPRISGAQWFYVAPGFQDSVPGYVQKTTYNKAITLYAIYEDGFTITLDDVKSSATGGDGSFAALNAALPVQESVSVPTCEGYTFNGYYEKNDDGTKNYWYNEEGSLIVPSEGTFSEAGHEYPLTANVTLYADWVRDVELDAQDGAANDKVHVTWAEDLPSEAIADGACDPATGPAAHTSKPIPVPTRAGYEFNGYWSTPYDESDPDSNLYYEVTDGAVVPVASKTWDIDQDRLYAHWKYKITLDLNTYNSDGDIVKNDAGTGFGASLDGYSPKPEQSVMTEGTMSVPSKNGGADDASVTSYMFTAVDGAPIQLPNAVGRQGYDDTRQWGTSRGEHGAATNIVELTDGVSAASPSVGAPTSYDEGVTLYANWASPKKYDVNLVFSYPYPQTDPLYSYEARTAEEGGTALATLRLANKSTYDAKLDLTGLSVDFAEARAAAGDDMLVLKGFYVEGYGKYSSKDPAHPLYSVSAHDTWYIDDAGAATRALRDVGDGTTVTLYALWGYPEVDIAFDMQDEALTGGLGSSNIVDGGEGVYTETLTTNDAMPNIAPLLAKHADARPGFAFNGFWTHPYKETGDDTAQYYAADGTCLYGDGTWDRTRGVTLYAHWRYDVFLDANAYNSSGEAVLNDAENDYAVALRWPSGVDPATDAFRTEQSGYSDSATHEVSAKVEQADGSAGAAEALSLRRYRFTAIDGAPIQLPQASDRRGYEDSRAWGTTPGSNGAASSIVVLNGDNVCDPFRPTLVNATDGTDGKAYVLYADWSGSHAQSGKPRTYTVKLLSTYDRADGADGFEVANGSLAEQSLEATYDAPLDASKFTAYKGGDGMNYVDATKDAAGASRNLVLKGFYRDECAVSGAGESNRVYVTVDSADAFSTAGLPFREVYAEGAAEIPLYAWWAYNVTDIAFDLQGGTIDSKGAAQLGEDALTIEGVTSHDPTPVLSGALATAPDRAGYEFAGWWNTPYNEGAATTDASGVTITPKRYYGDGTSENVDVNLATWEEFGTTTLYAHWKYDIAFDTNVDPATDLASVSLSTVRATNDEARTTGTVPLARAGVSTDDYGNEYTAASESIAGYGNSDYETLSIRAIAGAPVQLPSAQMRRERATSGYVRIGYDATWKWAHDAAGDAAVLNPEESADRFTALSDAWTDDATSLPCKIGGDTNQGTLTLYAQWKGYEKEYGVVVNYAYEADATSYATKDSHADSLAFKVTYDHDDYTALDDGSSFGHPLAPSDSSTAHAVAVNNGTEYDDLDFAGITTSKNDFLASSGNADYPTEGTIYWNAQGEPQVKRFRAITGADVDVYNTTDKPFPMYVAWAQPTREVTFNLFDEPKAADSTKVVDLRIDDSQKGPLRLQKGDSVGSSISSEQLKDLAERIVAQQNESNYLFAGFWSAPAGYEPYEEVAHEATADPTATPTCYYVLNEDGELVAAAPTDDGWLSSGNTSDIWLEDANTTLYAHWKYDLSFQVDTDDTIPLTNGASDKLLFGVADEAFSGATSEKVLFTSIDLDRTYIDARGMITYGSPLVVPMNRNANTTEAVSRIRDFSDPSAAAYGFTGFGRTGYEFAGWTTASDSDASDENLLTAESELTAASLKPAAGEPNRGHVTLYAQWRALPYEVIFEHYPQTMYGDVITDASVKAPRTKLTMTLPYDSPFSAVASSIAPPSLYGFDYLGYYSREGGRIDGDDVVGAGVRFFTATSPDVGDPTVDGRSLATSTPWFAPVTATSRTATVYAYYARLSYNMHFELRDAEDGTLQLTEGEVADQRWCYGDKLWEGSTPIGANDEIDWDALLPQNASFSRHGYIFDGWYFLEDEPESFESVEAEQAWHADRSNRIYMYRVDNTDAANPMPLYGVWTYDGTDWTRHDDIVTWRTVEGLIDAEKPHTFYASWTPKTYEVTFNTNYQNGIQSSEVTKTYSYEEMIGPDFGNATLDPTSAGAPFNFLGWNEKTVPEADGWLFDKSDYASHPEQANRDYPHMMPTVAGRFMPSTTASAFRLYGIWEDPGRKNIVLFSGAHGTLQGGTDASEPAYEIISHDFRYGWEIDSEGLRDRTNPIKLSVENGYEHMGWVELSPADITGVAETTDYAGLDKSAEELRGGLASSIASRVNDEGYEAAFARFPEVAKVTDKTTGYVNPYTGQEGFTFRDIYLVAVYKVIGDYGIVLDLGAAADYSDSEYPSLGARIDTADNPFSPRTTSPNISYGYTFSVRESDFPLPDAFSSMHDFQGWRLPDGRMVKDARPSWLNSDGSAVDVSAYVDYAKANPHTTVLTAVWQPKDFTVVFRSDHGDEGLTENEDITLRDVKIGDKFTLPYPATRGEGSYFSSWRLVTTDEDYPLTGRFNAGTEIDLRKLLDAVNRSLDYPDDSPSGVAVVQHVDVTDDTIVFDASWNQAISVDVPIEVCVKVDAANDTVLTMDDLALSTRYGNDAQGRSKVEVVSLRYDRVEAKPGEYVFGTDLAGRAFLSVYADLATTGDTSHLFAGSNLNDDGTLRSGVEGEQKKPLLIDLSRSAVYSDAYPSTTGSGTFDGLYDGGYLDGENSDHRLADHGFRAFSVDDKLPIRYGLLFRDIDDLLAVAPLLGELESDTDAAFPIAKLYYTIGLSPSA